MQMESYFEAILQFNNIEDDNANMPITHEEFVEESLSIRVGRQG